MLSTNGKTKARVVRGRDDKSRVSRVLVASTLIARGQLARAPPMWQEKATSQEAKRESPLI